MVYAATPTKIGSIDVSLAEELSAIRLKLERMRLDKEETEKMLRERDLAMEAGMKELVERGEIQKMLKIEVDRLFRLKELKNAHCTLQICFYFGRTLEAQEDKMGQGQYCHFTRGLWGPKTKMTSFWSNEF
ncbi:high mobility group B protein 6-like [Rhododendron vialii]|uniref:high mobility group B protein 6-like n=1 Tax=Rhododendron vialii TaxID=182163 RepID=UPI00266031B0|nr:high mobility group B protein 6-like [Rhododendron vialii]